MNCNDVDRLLMRMPFRVAVNEHLETCERCQTLVRALNAPVPADMPLPETIRRIERTLRAKLEAVRPLPPPRYFLAGFVLLFVSAACVVTYLWGAAAIPLMSSAQMAAILAVMAISAGWLANSLAHQMVPASKYRMSPNQLPLVIVLVTAAAIAIFFPFEREHGFWTDAWPCLRAGTLAGLIAAVPFWLVLRRSAILSPTLTGATTGLLAGLIGTAALEMHCPDLDAWHILTGHLGAAVLCCLAGFCVGMATERLSFRFRKRLT